MGEAGPTTRAEKFASDLRELANFYEAHPNARPSAVVKEYVTLELSIVRRDHLNHHTDALLVGPASEGQETVMRRAFGLPS